MTNEQFELIREQFLYKISKMSISATFVNPDERSLEIFAETYKSLISVLNDLNVRLDKDEISDLLSNLSEDIRKPVREHVISMIASQN